MWQLLREWLILGLLMATIPGAGMLGGYFQERGQRVLSFLFFSLVIALSIVCVLTGVYFWGVSI